MIVLHTYTNPEDDLEKLTWAARNTFPWPKGWKVKDILCDTLTRYEESVRQYWGKDDLIVWERDIVPTWEMLEGLARCKELLCVQDYIVGEHSICRVADERNQYRPAEEHENYADAVGFGLARISLGFQKAHPKLDIRGGTWADFDGRVFEWTKRLGYRWHIHRPKALHLRYEKADA